MNVKIVECEVERLLAVIAGKWKVLILRELFNGPRRHAQLRKALAGISQKVLTAQLRELELDGAVKRKDFAAKRPHVEYSLSPFGERLRSLILEMHDLARENCELLKRRPPAGRFERTARTSFNRR
jgi:DNA-binding HxlR family transcriptional regulator